MSFFLKKTFESVVESSSATSLKKNLTAFDLVLLGLGAIIGTGVFVLTGLIASKYSGPAIIISYVIAGTVCIFVALVYTEICTMLPTSGSVYSYSYVAFGEGFAWITLGVLVVEMLCGTAAVSAGWSAYIVELFNNAGIHLPKALIAAPSEGGICNVPALIITAIVALLLYLGTKESKKMNAILVLIKMTVLTIFLVLAAPKFDIKRWEVFMPFGFNKVITGGSILFFAYTGFGIIAASAEECKNPKKDITIGIIGSLVISILIYVVISAVVTGAVYYYELDNPKPLAYVLTKNGIKMGSMILSVGAVCGMTTVIIVQLYAASRVVYVASRDGLLPSVFSKVHSKYHSPYVSIGVVCLASGLLGGLVPCQTIAQLSSMGALFDYSIVALIVMLFRITKKDYTRPFKCPAIFIVAPIAFISCTYLLSRQIVDSNFNILLTGKILFSYIAITFVLYFVNKAIR